MMRALSLFLFIFIVSACQTTSNDDRVAIADYLNLELKGYEYKVLAFGEVYYSSRHLVAYGSSAKDLEKLVQDTIANCNQKGKSVIMLKPSCEIRYLGNQKISYSNTEELSYFLNEYKEKVDSVKTEIAANPIVVAESTLVTLSKLEKAPIVQKLYNDDIAVIIGNQNYNSRGVDIPDVLPAKNDALLFKLYVVS